MVAMKVEGALKDYFSPEFLNRIDDTIVFNKLTKENALAITKLLVNEYVEDIKKKRIKISYTHELIKFITEKGFNDKFGARPLRRAITKYIEDAIALGYIKGELKENKQYLVDVKDNNVIILPSTEE